MNKMKRRTKTLTEFRQRDGNGDVMGINIIPCHRLTEASCGGARHHHVSPRYLALSYACVNRSMLVSSSQTDQQKPPISVHTASSIVGVASRISFPSGLITQCPSLFFLAFANAWFPAFRIRCRSRFRKNRVCTCRLCRCCWGVCAAIARQAQKAGRRVSRAKEWEELQARSLAYKRQIRKNRTRSYINR